MCRRCRRGRAVVHFRQIQLQYLIRSWLALGFRAALVGTYVDEGHVWGFSAGNIFWVTMIFLEGLFECWTIQLMDIPREERATCGFLSRRQHHPSSPPKTAPRWKSIEVHAICVIVHMLGSALETQRIILMSFVRHLHVLKCNCSRATWQSGVSGLHGKVQVIHDIRRLIRYQRSAEFMLKFIDAIGSMVVSATFVYRIHLCASEMVTESDENRTGSGGSTSIFRILSTRWFQ
jgi:hypothetical protein